VCRHNWHSAGSLVWPFPMLKYEYIFQIKYTAAILFNSTRKLLWFEVTKMLIAVLRNMKLSYRRRTARCIISVEVLPIATQQCKNYLYDKSWTKYQLSLIDPKSCCRQCLTICAIKYSGRASELGGIIDLVDRRRPSLSCSERPPFSS